MAKKKPTEIEKMNNSFAQSTGMKVIQNPQPQGGTISYAKDEKPKK